MQTGNPHLRKAGIVWLQIMLVGGIAIQSLFFVAKAGKDLAAIFRVMGQSGLWRGARFYAGERFANYVSFLHEHVPPDGLLVLPPVFSGPQALGSTPYMQFFLSPRQVINCPDVACLEGISPQNTYFVITDPAHASWIRTSAQTLAMFDDHWGLVLPADSRLGSLEDMKPFDNLAGILGAAFWPLVWLGLLAGCGSLLTCCLLPELDIGSILALGYGLGMGLLTLCISGAAMLGLALTARLCLWITILLLGASMSLAVLRRREIWGRMADSTISLSAGVHLWPVSFFLLAGFALLLAVGEGYHATDEIMLWGAKGYGLASAGSLKLVTEWGTNTTTYPLHVPVLIAAFRLLNFESLPASKMVFSGYYLGLMTAAYCLLLRLRVKRSIAGLSSLFMATTPLIFRHATLAYANLPLSYFLVTAVLLLALCFGPEARQNPERLTLLSSLFFILAAWSRPEGLLLAWLCVGMGLALAIISRRGLFSWRQVLLLAMPLGIYAGFWWLLKLLVYSRLMNWTNLVSNALVGIEAGNWHVNEASYLVQALISRLASLHSWGIFGWGCLLVLVAAIVLPRHVHPEPSILLMASGLLIGLAVMGIYYLTSYDLVHDISWWVDTGLERMIFPAVMLLWLGGISRVRLCSESERMENHGFPFKGRQTLLLGKRRKAS